jgi:hypothetical protein
VAEALLEADMAKGLGRGGPAVSALEDVVRTNDAPVRGVATFAVVVAPNGTADVRLDGANADFDGWSRLTQAMSEAVAHKKLRIPAGTRGLRVTVRIEARVQWPNGKTPEQTGAYARTTGLQLSEDSIVVKSVPAVNAGVVGKVCSAGVHVGIDGVGIAGGCDPENIGAHAVRVVSGREMSEVAL